MTDIVEAKVWVVCSRCKGKHRVIPGVGSPMYWCDNTLCSLKAGDDVEVEDEDDTNEVFA